MLGFQCVYRLLAVSMQFISLVPKRLRALVGRGEIHTSTGLRDWNAAKLAALTIHPIRSAVSVQQDTVACSPRWSRIA